MGNTLPSLAKFSGQVGVIRKANGVYYRSSRTVSIYAPVRTSVLLIHPVHDIRRFSANSSNDLRYAFLPVSKRLNQCSILHKASLVLVFT